MSLRGLGRVVISNVFGAAEEGRDVVEGCGEYL